MKLVTFSLTPGELRSGVLLPGLVIDLAAAALLAFEEDEARRWDLLSLLADEDEGLSVAAEVAEAVIAQIGEDLEAGEEAIDAEGLAGALSIGGAEMLLPLSRVRLHAPLPRPMSLRRFESFEDHVTAVYRSAGRYVPATWYDAPLFVFGNHGAIYGPDAHISMPHTQALDYGLGLGCVIGRTCRDLEPEDAEQVIAGLLVVNSWCARDVEREEPGAPFGPAKSHDFAVSLGPSLVTLDALAEAALPDGRHSITLVARVNGIERSRANARDSFYTFGELIAQASRNCTLVPGDVIAAGTVGGGSLLEQTTGQGPWLVPGDEVELVVSGLGTLRNTIQ